MARDLGTEDRPVEEQIAAWKESLDLSYFGTLNYYLRIISPDGSEHWGYTVHSPYPDDTKKSLEIRFPRGGPSRYPGRTIMIGHNNAQKEGMRTLEAEIGQKFCAGNVTVKWSTLHLVEQNPIVADRSTENVRLVIEIGQDANAVPAIIACSEAFSQVMKGWQIGPLAKEQATKLQAL